MPQEAGIRARPEAGGLYWGRGVQSLLKKLRDWSEPEGGWDVFPFPGKKKEKQPFPWELKIELRAGQAVAWQGGGMLLPGAEPSSGRPWPWGAGGAAGKGGGLVKGCECQLT